MNPYDILGVSPDAPDEEIAKAKKRLAKRYHPDLNPGSADAAERMGEINRAYDDIKAMRQRGQQYDPYQAGPGAGSAAGGPFDPFFTGRTYYYTYRPRHSPVGAIIAILVTFFIVRLILSLLFGGLGGYGYYAVPGGAAPGGYYYSYVPYEPSYSGEYAQP